MYCMHHTQIHNVYYTMIEYCTLSTSLCTQRLCAIYMFKVCFFLFDIKSEKK